ncbi:MAG: hypothetical protein HQL66_03915 [Magnetococcales bacterium]|nr:hypothetical protein [Magnetococcales bacterium]
MDAYPLILTVVVVTVVGLVAAWNDKAYSLEEGILGLVIIAFSFHSTSRWLVLRKKGMPFVEMYSFVVGLYYGLPMIAGMNGVFGKFVINHEFRVRTGLAVLASLVVTLAAYTWSKGAVRLKENSIAPKEIPLRMATFIFQAFLALSTVYNILFQIGVVQPLLGGFQATMNILLTNVMGTVSSYVLFRLIGEKKLSRRQTVFTAGSMLISVLVILNGLMLVNVVLWVFPALLGFTLGRGRVPIKMVILVVSVVALLSIGKGTARNIHWGSRINSVGDIYNRLVDWTNISLQAFQMDSDANTFVLADRINFSGVLGMVIQRTPDEVPFIGGTTYAMLPSMIVPRFLWPEKPDGHAATIYLGVHYGVHTIDEVIMTSIGIGLLGEAYANFGFTGVFVFSGLLGWVLGHAHRMDARAPPLSVRSFFLVGLLSSVTKIEFALVEIIIPLVQIVAMLLLIYGWLVRRRQIPRRLPGYA